MLSLIALFLQFIFGAIIISNAENVENQENLSIYPVIMPMVVPARNEVYLCTSVDLSQTNETFWIRGFEPRVSDNVHHMALAGSNTKPPKTKFNLWNCGSNGKPAKDPNYPTHGVFPDATEGDDTTLYLWGMGGNRTMLPPNTGFKVGAGSKIKYLVLQVHYINIEDIDIEGDSSGIYVYYTKVKQNRLAGMLSMHVDTNVPSFARSFQDVACKVSENKKIYPHSLMMHTHRHGKVVSAWRVRRDLAGRDQWTLLDKRNPTKAQHFYPLQDPTTVLRYGDTMAFRCTMVNLSSTGVKQGLASYNEMCDLYMIYYVESDQESDLLQKSNFCWSPGPPEVSWYSLGLKDVPNAEASRLP